MAGRPKKATIRPFRSAANRSSNESSFLDDTWKKLKEALVQILHRREGKLSYEELYRCAYNLVLHRRARMLYAGVDELTHTHCRDLRDTVADAREESATFVETLVSVYDTFFVAMLMIRDVLLFLDRNYSVKERHTPIFDLGMGTFKQEVIDDPVVNETLRECIRDALRRERQGEAAERSALKKVSNMLISFGNAVDGRSVYQQALEMDVVEQTAAFYASERQKHLTAMTCPEYFKMASRRLEEETERVAECFASQTIEPVRNVVRAELLQLCLNELLDMDTGVAFMVDNDRIEDLRLCYVLLGPVEGGHDALKQRIHDHLLRVGQRYIVDDEPEKTKAAVKFTQAMLSLKGRHDRMLQQAFFVTTSENKTAVDTSFKAAIGKAFEAVVNSWKKSAEYLSLYIDDKLKRGVKEMTDAEVDTCIAQTVGVFRYLEEKDMFERFYGNHLAKRLLNSRSASDEAERVVLTHLKSECGSNFTHKLFGMFKDIQVSRDTMDLFRKSHSWNRFDMQVKVLTTTHWSLPTMDPCLWPDELMEARKAFETFYSTRHSGRKLQWHAYVGNIELNAKFAKRKHILTGPTHYAFVLLLFNKHATLTFQQIQEQTGLNAGELKRCLLCLTRGKTRILTKTPDSKSIDETDTFQVNDAFTSKLTRVKIQQLVVRDDAAASEEVREAKRRVDEERKHVTDACIVRIMKSRKTLTFSQLITEVVGQLSSRFKPNLASIKKRIESLIDRDFLERDPNDRNICHYLA